MEESWLDGCWHDLHQPQSVEFLTQRALSGIALTTVFVAVGVSVGLLAVGHRSWPRAVAFLFLGVLAVAYYWSWSFLVQAAKHVLDDRRCGHGRPNSVSGHFSYHAFFAFVLPYLWRVWALGTSSAAAAVATASAYPPRSAVFARAVGLLALAVFACASVYTLWNTYFWGYHSLRQVLYGVASAVLAALGFAALAEPVAAPLRRPLPVPGRSTLIRTAAASLLAAGAFAAVLHAAAELPDGALYAVYGFHAVLVLLIAAFFHTS